MMLIIISQYDVKGNDCMKKILTALLIFFVFVYALPVLTVGAYGGKEQNPAYINSPKDNTDYKSALDVWNDTVRDLTERAAQSVSAGEQSSETSGYDAANYISVLIDGQPVQMTVQDYLVGVVAAEMPAAFPMEALKAQAVAARSYMLHKIEMGGASHSGGAQLCDDYTHCTAFFDVAADGKKLWGDDADYYAERIYTAVCDTDGIVAVSNGQTIAAVFHSASSEMTEDAENVWGVKYSYLTSVSSVGGSASPNYYGTVAVKQTDFKSSVLAQFPEASFDADPSRWIGNIKRSQSGSVLEMDIGGVTVKGTQVRSMFSLNSANFSVEIKNTEVIFSTVGTGHGVGMSQYGAREMALNGAGFDEIICHYYSGVSLMVKN